MTDTGLLEVMDSQRFDVTKRRKNSTMNLSIQTGLSDEEHSPVSPHSSSLLSITPAGSWDSLARDFSTPELSDSVSDSPTSPPSTPPSPVRDHDNGELFYPTAVSFVTPRINPILRCFSRPSSPVPSRPSSPLRPRSPINFCALNCFSNADAFTEHVDHLQAQRARELAGLADVKVHVHQVIATDSQTELPWFAQRIIDPEALRLQRTRDEPRGVVSCP
ncbi:hypothetical protein B0H12DRAFT_649890 [Mycena haematopus]|nr:hypothetical protein B0H12DRAFT_649890 [Mycena haematopus]